jgi:hypothetical protein
LGLRVSIFPSSVEFFVARAWLLRRSSSGGIGATTKLSQLGYSSISHFPQKEGRYLTLDNIRIWCKLIFTGIVILIVSPAVYAVSARVT